VSADDIRLLAVGLIPEADRLIVAAGGEKRLPSKLSATAVTAPA